MYLSDKNHSHNDRVVESLYGTEGYHVFIRTKAERIVTALYLISGLMSDDEPLKWGIRRKSLQLLEAVYIRQKELFSSLHADRTESLLLEIASLVSIAHAGGMISDMNSDLVRRELEGFMLTFKNKSEESRIPHDFLSIKVPEAAHSARTRTESTNVKKRPVREAHSKGSSGQLEDRKEKVYAFVREQKDVSIKDIVEAVSGYSEKTLTRDLQSLVQEGRVVREGDRRWTRYKVA